MPNARTIDRTANPFECLQAADASSDARHQAGRVVRCLGMQAHYEGSNLEGAAETAAAYRARVADASRKEREAMHRVNDALARAGAAPGDEYLIGRHWWRASAPGRAAAYLGLDLPDDELAAQWQLPEEDDERAALAERQAEFAALVHIPR